ncbi:hypothetical protein HR12_26585, partial [Microbacterium sp. SUBG005]
MLGRRRSARGDRARRVRQIVDNLLSNAIKYVPRAAVSVTVLQDVHSVSIVVADDGPGISVAEQARLFERFFRGDAVRNSSAHGSGLGLAISRDLARAHGGEITVRTRGARAPSSPCACRGTPRRANELRRPDAAGGGSLVIVVSAVMYLLDTIMLKDG